MDNQVKVEKINESFTDWFNTGEFKIAKMTSELYPYENMFKPIKINNITVKNRLVMAPMGNINMSDETGRPNEKMIAYFTERAKGGVGLITTGLIPVGYGIDNALQEPDKLSYFPRIDRSRTVLAAWRNIAAQCHTYGSKIFIQLSPGLGRVGNPMCLVHSYKLPVSASWNPNFYISNIPSKPLTDFECKRIIKKIGQSSADAKVSNIDGIYLHGHEGYLLEQMTNTAYNRRKIGRYSNWQNFGIDMVKEIRKRVGNNYPIMYRIDLSLMLNATYGDKLMENKELSKFKNERTVDQTIDYMKNLVKAGVDIFDVDLGCYENWWLPHPPSSMPPGCYLGISKIVKQIFEDENILSNVGLKVPIVGVGKLGYPDVAEKALIDGDCDMVMLGRPLLADPQWPNKAYQGEVKDIIPCIGCQEACINEFVEGGHPQCAVNPRTSFEHELSKTVEKADVKKKVIIIGAGPAGIISAITLIKRGHSVDLYEKEETIGGMIIPGSIPKIKYDFGNYLNYLEYQIEKLKDNEDFNLYLNQQVDIEMIKRNNYDVVITASGAKQNMPNIKGIDSTNVYSAIEILDNVDLVKEFKDVVVIGGGVVGCETAHYLKYEHDKNVKIIEQGPYFMNHTCTANRGHLIHTLEKANVELLNCTSVSEIKSDSVDILKNVSKTVPDPYNTWSPILPENIENPFARTIKLDEKDLNIKADAVIVAVGISSENKLYYDCVKNNIAKEIWNVGDSNVPKKVYEAIHSAYRLAREI